ncbi:hypothetical protein [Virgibacillus halodenitrificans]|nr:hypothetical protein [Virgibacillus halodenitrificans]MEC2158227.1 hypothetical protein [Virgibacillus halodenitrificans]CDQ31153.1 hypothetical protein BN993_00525 [Virgibacillus halodenitrificans]
MGEIAKVKAKSATKEYYCEGDIYSKKGCSIWIEKILLKSKQLHT